MSSRARDAHVMATLAKHHHSRDIKTRLIDSQPQAEAPVALAADRGVNVNKPANGQQSGGCC